MFELFFIFSYHSLQPKLWSTESHELNVQNRANEQSLNIPTVTATTKNENMLSSKFMTLNKVKDMGRGGRRVNI